MGFQSERAQERKPDRDERLDRPGRKEIAEDESEHQQPSSPAHPPLVRHLAARPHFYLGVDVNDQEFNKA
jgi:hypothetical protein